MTDDKSFNSFKTYLIVREEWRSKNEDERLKEEKNIKMEALVCKKLGDPTALKSSISEADNDSPIILSKTHPIPQLKSPTSVRVRVKATSLNYANYLQILGKYQEKPPLPFIPGSDYSGIVDAVGSGVSPLKVGDRVCSFAALGSFAEFIVADQAEL